MDIAKIATATDIGYMLSHSVGTFLKQVLPDASTARSAKILYREYRQMEDAHGLNIHEFRQAAKAAGFILERRTRAGRTEHWIRRRRLRRYDGRTYGDPAAPVRRDLTVRVRGKYSTYIPEQLRYHVGEFMVRHASKEWVPNSTLHQAFERELGITMSRNKFGRLLKATGWKFKRKRHPETKQVVWHARYPHDEVQQGVRLGLLEISRK